MGGGDDTPLKSPHFRMDLSRTQCQSVRWIHQKPFMKSLVTLYGICATDITVEGGLVGPVGLGLAIHTTGEKAKFDADVIDNRGHQVLNFMYQAVPFSK